MDMPGTARTAAPAAVVLSRGAMAPQDPPDALICPVCWKPITPSDPLSASNDEVIHAACRPGEASPGTVVLPRGARTWRRHLVFALSRCGEAVVRIGPVIRASMHQVRERRARLRRCHICGALDWRGRELCVTCGTPFASSGSQVPLSGRRPRASRSRPDLLIVSRERPDLYDVLTRFGRSNLEVRLDQRLGDRRRGMTQPVAPERRRALDRRARNVTVELALLGWAIVPAAQRQRRAH